MEYRDLATLYHMDSSSSRESSIQGILKDRIENDSTFKLGFFLPSGELFLAVPRELNALTQKSIAARAESVKSYALLAGHRWK